MTATPNEEGEALTPWLSWPSVIAKATQLLEKRLVMDFMIVEKGEGD